MTTVAVSGYFDPLHVGHIEYMELAKALGNKLVVILNNEKQTMLKRGKKPFMPLNERKKILEALKFVDKVLISVDEDLSVCETLKFIKPHIFANGGDRNKGNIPETKVCEELGIKIVDGLGRKIQSSSELIK